MGSWAKNLFECITFRKLQETVHVTVTFLFPSSSLHVDPGASGLLNPRERGSVWTPRKAGCGQAVLLISLSLSLCQTPRLRQPRVLCFAFLYPLPPFPPFPPSDLWSWWLPVVARTKCEGVYQHP